MNSLNLLFRHGSRTPARKKPEPNRYWLTYRERTGLGSPVKMERFDSLAERFRFAVRVDVVGFGQEGS